MCSVESQPLFRDLSGDDPDPEVTQIESLCMNCHASGVTRLLLTRIPHYKSVVLMSFSCEECGFENNEIQPGNAVPDHGVRFRLQVSCRQDLDRQLVKSEHTSVRIPAVDFEIPAQSQQGEITTVEGVLTRALAGLKQDQAARREVDPEAAGKIDAFCDRMETLLRVEEPFYVELEDISGNCFVENPEAPRRDPRCWREEFTRTPEQDHKLGIFTRQEVSEEDSSVLHRVDPTEHSYDKLESDEVMTLDTNCPDCGAPAATNCKLTDIPHFKQVLIMATICDACGHRTNEVKSGGGIEKQGVRFELRINGTEDFSRDVLKSETCSMSVPELSLEVGGRALGGRFSTAEGLLRAARDQLADAPGVGDAASLSSDNMKEFLSRFDEVLAGQRAVTLVLDDPAGNSYVQSLSDDPAHTDPGLKIVHYERTFEQNDELGLNDMKTEGYEAEEEANGYSNGSNVHSMGTNESNNGTNVHSNGINEHNGVVIGDKGGSDT